jgi:hypothetical protein
VGAASASGSPVEFGDVVVIGGGCYGTFYARQLERARELGKARWRRVLVVDRDPACRFAREPGAAAAPHVALVTADWGEFLDGYLGAPRPATAGMDGIVPSPLMPHLLFEWLVRRARARWPGRGVEVRPAATPVGTPYDATGPDGTRYVSFADWICPIHCVEPLSCPMIRAPRTWEVGEALEGYVERLAGRAPTAGPVLFQCLHRVHGVGMIDTAAVEAGEALLARAAEPGSPVDVVVGTVSACHGAVSLLHLGPLVRPEPPAVYIREPLGSHGQDRA